MTTAAAFKKPPKKEEPKLTAVLILDVFDQRFAPIHDSFPCFGTLPICNVPAVNFCLSWLMRTEVKSVMLVVSRLNEKHAQSVRNEWKLAFEELTVVAVDGATSVGDCMREVHNRELITADFMLITNPTSVVSTTLAPQIAEFRKRRRENPDNVMTMVYSNRENPEHFVIGVSSETSKLMLYPAANSLNQLKAEKRDFYEGVDIRRDLTHTGIAFCSRLIATQFSDNFDFVGIDDVVREILSKDDILGMSVHVEVLPTKDRAFCAFDYESLILLNTLLLERWFYPVTPENSDPTRFFSANPRNCYLEEDGDEISIKANTWILNDQCSTVSLGQNATVSYDTVILNSSIGAHTDIAQNSRIVGSIIGANCKIGAGCQIQYAFIGDNVTIPAGTNIQKETIVGRGVVFPKDLPAIHNSAVLKSPINEEKYEKLTSQHIGSVHVAKFRHGGPFWRRAVDGKTFFGVDDEGCSDEEETSDDDDVDDTTRQFHDEVFESMQKTLESENQVMRNLILEINSSKLACNVTMDEVARNVFAAFLKLPHNQQLAPTKDLIKKWRDLFINYYISTPESLRKKTADQQRFEIELKKKCQIQMLLSIEDRTEKDPEFLTRVPHLVHFLFTEELAGEEAILEWHGSIDEEERAELKQKMQPIVDWLEEEEEDEEETDEEEE
uniref:Translation initiation factor eIF2B subunit epsilon n=1 Tax=Caenorhabditis tropicalis TaxID=1561998 RepID=A0A1I7U5J8_9PELO